jgi:hypothetical protein
MITKTGETAIYKAVDSGRLVVIGHIDFNGVVFREAEKSAGLLDHDEHLQQKYDLSWSGELTFYSQGSCLTAALEGLPFRPAPEAPQPPPIGRGKRQANRKKNKAADASRKKNRRR